jgi:beta-glucosidase
VIVVLFNGRPPAIPQIEEKAAAILEAWLPGTEGFTVVEDILFGEVDPSGRLTTTFPYSVGQVPIYYNQANTGRPGCGEWKGNYVDGPTAPLFPFGFGLAYTTFEFSKVELDSPTVKMNGMINARVTIKNTGTRAGTAVAELFIRDLACSGGARPVRELKSFRKILLQPGESREVPFRIFTHALGCWDSHGHWIVEPGKYQLWISKDSASGSPAEFTVTE